MTDDNRYSRQIAVNKIGEKGQEQIRNSIVTIVGCGALGSRTTELLIRAGVGKIILIDKDKVELSNLQRQTLYDEKDVGKHKVVAAKEKINLINSEVKVKEHIEMLNLNNLNILQGLILDCVDNLETRFLINKHCIQNNFPWIHAAVAADHGFVYAYVDKNQPCLECFLPKSENPETAQNVGILNTTVSMVSTIQATEAIKFITKQQNETKLIKINSWDHEIIKLNVRKNINCDVCSKS